jgi:oligoendopeptidase F
MNAVSIPQPRERHFLPKEFKITVWSKLKPYYNELLNRPIDTPQTLEQWIKDRCELEAVVSEEFSWRYIRVTRDSGDQRAVDLYEYAVEELSPRVSSFENSLNCKLADCPLFNELEREKYAIYRRNLLNALQLFREENIPLNTEVQLKSKEYGRIFSEMTIGLDGKQMTLQKAGAILEETDRNRREAVYHKINGRILQEKESLEGLFDDLLEKRHTIARNAGYDNFRDFRFQALGRFDYTAEDCFTFHDSIIGEILPLVDELKRHRKQKLGVERLRPWDLNVDTSGQSPLRPFHSIDDLTEKTISCLGRLHPVFGQIIDMLRSMGRLDLDSRQGKRPGGYNMPLQDSGAPFIFMNAANSLNDMRTFMHECGHAIHSVLTRGLPLNTDRRFPSEVSELAAMSMELLSMEHWDIFFPSEADMKRARVNQLETVLKVLPWIACIDKFQHWIYTHPRHSREERKRRWQEIYREFGSSMVDYTGLDHYVEYLWHKQLHLFEVPFYYIEYGMAQLGAIAMWKQYREHPAEAIQRFIEALRLGYSRSIGEIYRAAGIRFDFSRDTVQELGRFVRKELESLLE